MQFSHRIGAVLVIIFLTVFVQILFRAGFNDDDRETRILESLGVLETQITEYESMVQSFRNELMTVKDRASKKCPCPNEQGDELRFPLLSRNRLKTLSIYNALPYLMDADDALTPALVVGKERVGVSLVIGIPTVKRPTQSYLIPTLQHLMSSMLPEEKNETLVIVLIAETDIAFVQSTINSITKQFRKEVDSGLIEVIQPSPNYYPDFKQMKPSLGDSLERTRWRTKQNLDYAYLMMYAQNRGTYFVQLEDDVLSKKGFVTDIRAFALQKTIDKVDWFMLDFCQLGFIGKLFRVSDLWRLADFFLLFYKDKPGDWLLAHFFKVKYCKLDLTHKKCVKEIGKHWVHYKPSLFQHIGMVSSLNGKVQKLKDKQFGKLELFVRHNNPSAKVESTIKQYGRYTLSKAYEGKSFFWGVDAVKGDTIKFVFQPPVALNLYKFVTGNPEHPSDQLHNATLEILPMSKPSTTDLNLSETSDGFFQIDEFGELGLVEGDIPDNLNPVSAVRITLKSASENWVILSEILLQKKTD